MGNFETGDLEHKNETTERKVLLLSPEVPWTRHGTGPTPVFYVSGGEGRNGSIRLLVDFCVKTTT